MSRNGRIALICTGVIAAMTLLVAFSLPMYRAFCAATGLGGTTRRVAADTAKAREQSITVRFNADVAPGLPWRFGPNQDSVTVHLGEQSLVSFWAENLSDQPIVGHATYNVTPDLAGRYFNKIQCFCFNEERLAPHQKVDMPVTFFVDPAILDDRDVGNLPTITLSYTFFKSADPKGALDLARFGPGTAPATGAGSAERGAAVFAEHCAACHDLDHNKVGPLLRGLNGRPAGKVYGFDYSRPLQVAPIVWNAETLDTWLADPRADVPGTRMPVALADAQARADVIAYLLSLPEGVRD